MLETDRLYLQIQERTELSRHLIRSALRISVEEALKEFFGIRSIVIHLDEKQAIGFFEIPGDITLKEAETFDNAVFEGDTVYITVDFESFPDTLFDMTRDYFFILLSDMAHQKKRSVWQNRTRSAVEGIITERTTDTIGVQLAGNATGIMKKREWVPKEIDHYYEGNTMMFYVLKTASEPLRIHLSRSSVNFPVALFKMRFPWGKFKSIKRYRGHKCMIKTDLAIDDNLKRCIVDTRRELNGEIVSVSRF